jgi:hypothetical protein
MRPELQDVVDEVARLVRRPVTLEDRHFNLVAFNAHSEQIDDVRQQSILTRRSTAEVRTWFEQFGIATADGPLRIPSSHRPRVLSRLCLPARWGTVTYGYLWVLDEEQQVDPEVLPSAMTLAERAGALMAQQARAREDLGFTLLGLLSSDGDTVERAAEDIAALELIRRDTPVAAVELRLLRPATVDPAPMNLWTLPRSVLARVGEDHTTLLVPVPDGDLGPARALARRTRELYLERVDVSSGVDLVAGIGTARDDIADARTSWREARLAARVLAAVEQLRPVAAWPDLGVYRLLACGPESTLAGAVLDDAVRRLLEHDDPDLRRTASAFLEQGGNVQRTAAALRVHRQTVYHRLERIEGVTGLDLASGDARLVLHLGLSLAPLVAPAVGQMPHRASG